MIQLDGNDGGGQILRSALSLSAITGQGFRIVNIRGKRKKGGLARQHLTCVRAVTEVCEAAVDGAELGSKELVFQPGTVKAGDYAFAIGTAGSTSLLAQTLLPILWSVEGTSTLRLEGGTHNPLAPTAHYLERVFLPTMMRMGAFAEIGLVKYGFVPAGGGVVELKVHGGRFLPLELIERGALRRRRIDCILANISEKIGKREIKAARKGLSDDWSKDCAHIISADEASCSGNVLEIEAAFEHVTERITVHGELGVKAERVGERAAKAMRNYLDSEAVVGLHLADQLLLPMALAGGNRFRTLGETNHIRTNIRTIEAFLDVTFAVVEHGNGIEVRVVQDSVAKARG